MNPQTPEVKSHPIMKSKWTDQKPFVASPEDTKKRWGGGFVCKMCGHKFISGDTVRWVYANGTAGMGTGNFLVCARCDGPDILDRAKADFELALSSSKRWGIA